LAGETEVLGEWPQCHFVHHRIPHDLTGLEPDIRGGKPATNRLSYGAALTFSVYFCSERLCKVALFLALQQSENLLLGDLEIFWFLRFIY
jgi:hypothetical protein